VPDDRESHPGTEPFVPDFDTGTYSQPFQQVTAAPGLSAPDPSPAQLTEQSETQSATAEAAPLEQAAAPVQSVTVPGRYYSLKWWKLILMITGAWIPASAIGPGLFYWWTQDHSPHKTPVVFVVLIYVATCTVAGLMLSMAEARPLVTALAIAVMSAPFASVAAAAPYYGAFYCDHAGGSCLLGIIPY
jgi:hypothetical protein